MISCEELQKSIFDEKLFLQSNCSLVIKEKGNVSKKATLQEVVLTSQGTFIECNLLKGNAEIFKKTENLSFKADCDKVFLLNKDNRQYLVLVELKSAYSSKAIWQLAASYVKCKMMLNAVKECHLEERAFIVSYPEHINPKQAASNSYVLNAKANIIMSSSNSIENKYKMNLLSGKTVIMDAKDFGLDKLTVNPIFLMDKLKLQRLPVPDGIPSVTFDIDKYL